jgi:hypothetical protein
VPNKSSDAGPGVVAVATMPMVLLLASFGEVHKLAIVIDPVDDGTRRAGRVRMVDLLVGYDRDVVYETVVVASRIREESDDFASLFKPALSKRRAGKLKKREYSRVVLETLGGAGAGQVKSNDHSCVLTPVALRANQAGTGIDVNVPGTQVKGWKLPAPSIQNPTASKVLLMPTTWV